jgi:hypothetical protein
MVDNFLNDVADRDAAGHVRQKAVKCISKRRRAVETHRLLNSQLSTQEVAGMLAFMLGQSKSNSSPTTNRPRFCVVADRTADETAGDRYIAIRAVLLPLQALAAVFIHARAMAQAGHLPAGVHHLLGHYAEVLDWSLKRHGADRPSVLYRRGRQALAGRYPAVG